MESADDDISIRVASFSCYLDTAKENLIHRVSAQENPNLLSPVKSKPPITKPPLNNNFSYSMDNKDSSLTNLRVDSFSYLNSKGDNFIFNVPGGTVQDPTFSFPAHTPKDGELSVFGADKYFNMKLEYPTRQGKLKSLEYRNERPVNLVSVGPSIAPKTPTMSSEASSFNSQTALLRGNGSQTKHQKKTFSRGIFAGFGCQGPCFNKKGVQTLVVPGAYYTSNPNRTALTSIPSHGKENFTVKKQEVPNANDTFEESRNSIEVFGSNASSKGNVATNMERKLSMLTWDAIPKGPTSVSSTICDDMASDASSDLFEIENISGSIYPISTTEAADDMSSCMSPTSHYAPSEASIQWSVVTASAADYSDYNDESSVSVAGDILSRNNNAITSKNMKKRVVGAKEVQKSTPGGFLGCKSHKAVDVAENASHKSGEKTKHRQGWII